MSQHIIQIDIVSDVTCPWCYIGKRRLERAIRSFQLNHSEVQFSIEWHPYLLDPVTPPRESYKRMDRMRQKFGTQAEEAVSRVIQIAETEGLKMVWDYYTGSTIDAHRLINLAKQLDNGDKMRSLENAIVEALFSAIHVQGRDITQYEILADIAASVGIDKRMVLAYLQTPQGEMEVRQEASRNFRRNINGVPHFLVGKRYALGGAQESEIFVEVFEMLLKLETP
ncbi:uncharacterized protein VTP21DRAFT_577 [Calcarisporiella thermophila]|uniref:uncharacterized protein n=1 Tax=Calcarisporiella thermophila TaxID=911321 RepID=UPI0037426584